MELKDTIELITNDEIKQNRTRHYDTVYKPQIYDTKSEEVTTE